MTGIVRITVVNAISIGTDITLRHDLQGFSADDDAVSRNLIIFIACFVIYKSRTENLGVSEIPRHIAV